VNFFSNNPFIKLLSFELTGIAGAFFFPYTWWLYLPLLLIPGIWLLVTIRHKRYPFDQVVSVLLAALVAFFSFTNARVYSSGSHPSYRDRQHYMAQITEKPHEKKHTFQTVLRILQSNSSRLNNQKIIAYLGKNEQVRKLEAGDLLLAESAIRNIRNNGNPFEFDYENYLAGKQIYYSTYIPAKNLRIKRKPAGFSGIPHAERFRNKLISRLKEELSNDQAFQIISALTLGYREELTPETRSFFTSAGAMHVLAVSGLHVGMLYLFLKLIFSFLRRTKRGRLLYVTLIVCCLWGYARLTGFSPSVQRASFMFTFILIGSSLHRPVSTYNSIAASAFFLLLINPNTLFNAGFQLSYMAVISIVFFYPRLESMITTNYRLLKKTGQLLCVSVAAQIGTFPLSIYYFHQFPVYFWLSNFVVIPAAYLLLGVTGIFFLLSPFEMATHVLARILTGVTDTTVWLLIKIGELPVAIINGLSLSTVQLFCVISILTAGMFFIKYGNHHFLFTGLSLVLLFEVAGFIEKAAVFNQEKLIFYTSRQPVVHLINGRSNYLIIHSDSLPDSHLYKNVLLKLKLEPPVFINLAHSNRASFRDLLIRKELMLFLNEPFIFQEGKWVPANTAIPNGSAHPVTVRSGVINLKN